MHPTDCDMRLIENWQRGFPLVPRPYAAIGCKVGLAEAEVIESLRKLKMAGVLVRVGATVRPNAAGASTLAALRVPSECMDDVAAIINAEPSVTHNYEREHAFNLWFVVTAADCGSVERVLDRIRRETRLEVLNLPLQHSYFIDLGFAVNGQGGQRAARPKVADGKPALPRVNEADRRLLRAIENGLPLAPMPYRRIAADLGIAQKAVMGRLASLLESGVINRLGLIVRHYELGFTANAMAVWDIADAEVDCVGERVATFPSVTLCYRRQRHPPRWPYNLFCMVHGRERAITLRHISEIALGAGIATRPHAVLFSSRRFKQRGATFAQA
jgi:DNA-binding Lrp family transcriptional regulator